MLLYEVISNKNICQIWADNIKPDVESLQYKRQFEKTLHLTAVNYLILMQLLNINDIFQMRSYRSGAVEAAMTHRMTKIAFG